jgi:hypothetical protein
MSEIRTTSEIIAMEKRLWKVFLSNRTEENKRRIDDFNAKKWVADKVGEKNE